MASDPRRLAGRVDPPDHGWLRAAEATPVEPIWGRQPGESEKAFAAFLHYAGLDPRWRSIEVVGRDLYPTRGTRKRGRTGCVHRWYRRWHWRERAAGRDEQRHRREAEDRMAAAREGALQLLRRVRRGARARLAESESEGRGHMNGLPRSLEVQFPPDRPLAGPSGVMEAAPTTPAGLGAGAHISRADRSVIEAIGPGSAEREPPAAGRRVGGQGRPRKELGARREDLAWRGWCQGLDAGAIVGRLEARGLGALAPGAVMEMIGRREAELRAEWDEEARREVVLQYAALQEMWSQLWEAWESSKEPRVRVRQRVVRGRTGAVTGLETRSEASDRCGDPRILDQMRRVLEAKRRLLGIGEYDRGGSPIG